VNASPDDSPDSLPRKKSLHALVAAIAGCLVFGLTFVAFTPPSPFQGLFFLSAIAWVCLVLYWLLALVISLACMILRGNWRRLAVPPALGLLMVVLALAHIPFRLAFALDRGAMNQAAREVMSGKRSAASIHWIGLFPVSYADGDRNGFWFEVKDTSPNQCSASGFSYTRGAADKSSGYRHLSGRWITYAMDCSDGALPASGSSADRRSGCDPLLSSRLLGST
jgi:hypothetical protein